MWWVPCFFALLSVSLFSNSMSYSVRQELLGLLELAAANTEAQRLFGELTPGEPRMPRSNERDARCLTWHKLATKIGSALTTAPQNNDDCWLLASNLSSRSGARHHFKLSRTGTGNKWQTHRLLYLLLHPDSYDSLLQRSLHVAHRCGNGLAPALGEPCCVNPYHCVLVTAQLNENHKGCKFGCAVLCPHVPKCIFVWPETGRCKPCFNNPDFLPAQCPHQPSCSHVSGETTEEQ